MKTELKALVEKERPHFLVREIEALATDELVRIEADGLCTVMPTARAAGPTAPMTDKAVIKRRCRSALHPSARRRW